jgi:GNAT superfamily N-acetyltransferase
MASVGIRTATLADLELLASIHEASARDAYRHIFPPAAAFPREAACAEIGLHLRDAAKRTTMASIDGAGVGLIVAGPASDRPPTLSAGTVGQISLLHVLPDARDRGIGTALLNDALAWLEAAGHAHSVLWVLVANDRARRFYEHRGWDEDGARRIEQHAIPIEIMRYRRAI